MAEQVEELTKAIDAEPFRTAADVRVSEILPLLAACRFLERKAAKALRPQSLGGSGRPWWLRGVESEVQRVALGRVLVIGPSNYPLFLPGVQVLQALVAGNAVVWKPGRGGAAVAHLAVRALIEAGVPQELVYVTAESVEAAEQAIADGPDKVFFTGSAAGGRAVMRLLAESATPAVMELSGCSSLIVLPEAELGHVAAAVAFGMRLNGGATCMAPRRLLVVGSTTARRSALVERILHELAGLPALPLGGATQRHLRALVDDARARGAIVHGDLGPSQRPVLLVGVTPEMPVAQSDLFAPVLSVIDVPDEQAVLAAERTCPYALSVSIFGDEPDARHLAAQLTVGTVVINDVIVPTADPRVPFGGRRASGFGVTRGMEGLLEMTAVKTVLARRGTSRRHLERTGNQHAALFDGVIAADHGSTWRKRWSGLKAMVHAARALPRAEHDSMEKR